MLKFQGTAVRIIKTCMLFWAGVGSIRLAADATWVPIGPEGGRILNIIQHPTQAPILYLTAGLRKGERQTSIYKSTDKGNSWNKLTTFNEEINCLTISRKNTNELFAGSHNQFSRSIDGGVKWDKAFFDKLTFQELSLDSLNANVIHACGYSYVSSSNPYALSYFKSTDKGATWSVKTVSEVQGFGQALCVDPKNPNVVLVGGYSADKSSVMLFKTTNGGGTWNDVSGSVVGSVFDILMDSTSVKRLFVVTGAGVFRSTDMGASWVQNSGWVSGNVLAQDHKNKNTLYLGGNNLTYQSTDGGVNWNVYSNGVADGGLVNAMLVDQALSSVIYLGSESGFYKSTDSGQSWTVSNAGILLTQITTLASLPANPAVIYAAWKNDYIFKTQNALGKAGSGQSVAWEKFYKIPNCDSYSVKTILFHPTQPNTIYVYKEYG